MAANTDRFGDPRALVEHQRSRSLPEGTGQGNPAASQDGATSGSERSTDTGSVLTGKITRRTVLAVVLLWPFAVRPVTTRYNPACGANDLASVIEDLVRIVPELATVDAVVPERGDFLVEMVTLGLGRKEGSRWSTPSPPVLVRFPRAGAADPAPIHSSTSGGMHESVPRVGRRQRFLHAQVAWMAATALALTLLDALTYELFFVVSLIGFLVVTELTAPFGITPRWRRRLRYVVALGLVVFAYVVIRRILEILPPGLV
jgi:hypothetical protein